MRPDEEKPGATAFLFFGLVPSLVLVVLLGALNTGYWQLLISPMPLLISYWVWKRHP